MSFPMRHEMPGACLDASAPPHPGVAEHGDWTPWQHQLPHDVRQSGLDRLASPP